MFSRMTLLMALATFLCTASYAQSKPNHDLPVVVTLHKMALHVRSPLADRRSPQRMITDQNDYPDHACSGWLVAYGNEG